MSSGVEPGDLVLPPDAVIGRLAEAAAELVQLDATLRATEEGLQLLRDHRTELATKLLPELFDQHQIDRIGVPEENCDVVVDHYYHANIAKEWGEERRAAAFDHLESLGAEGLIRCTVTVELDRGALALARRLAQAVEIWLRKAGAPAPKVRVERGVPWKTLTSWLREQVRGEAGLPPLAVGDNYPRLDPERIGATIGRVCRVVPRK